MKMITHKKQEGRAVKANELRLDNLFELADNSIALIDYESEYSKEDKVKYLNYLTGIANRYQKMRKECPRLRMIVIYTGDIKRGQVSQEYDIGAVKMTLEPAFLSELDANGIFQHLKHKVEKKELLDDEELMKFIILPLSYHEKEEKEEKIRETVELAVKLQDRSQQLFALAGLLTFTEKKLLKQSKICKANSVIRPLSIGNSLTEGGGYDTVVRWNTRKEPKLWITIRTGTIRTGITGSGTGGTAMPPTAAITTSLPTDPMGRAFPLLLPSAGFSP